MAQAALKVDTANPRSVAEFLFGNTPMEELVRGCPPELKVTNNQWFRAAARLLGKVKSRPAECGWSWQFNDMKELERRFSYLKAICNPPNLSELSEDQRADCAAVGGWTMRALVFEPPSPFDL